MNEKTLSGRTAIITGASQGLGIEISKRFVVAGANVILCARSYGLLEEIEQELNLLLADNQKIYIKKCDSYTLEFYNGFYRICHNKGTIKHYK